MFQQQTSWQPNPVTRSVAYTRPRAVHLIDIENLVGSGRFTASSVRMARDAFFQAVDVAEDDHVILASSRGNLLAVSAGWPQARYLARDGKDGADMCLARVILEENLDGRFDLVVMGSGDGGLAPFVSHLASRGVETVVVARPESLSPRMRMAAHRNIEFIDQYPSIA